MGIPTTRRNTAGRGKERRTPIPSRPGKADLIPDLMRAIKTRVDTMQAIPGEAKQSLVPSLIRSLNAKTRQQFEQGFSVRGPVYWVDDRLAQQVEVSIADDEVVSVKWVTARLGRHP